MAAHQVEGGLKNDWTEWEEKNAERLAKTAKKRVSWVPSWHRVKGRATTPENYISGNGVEHFKRYKDDIKLARQLNFNVLRFGIEWARLEPEEGKWDEYAFEHYRDYLKELKKNNLEPFPTLWHWTVPVWFAKKGAFLKKENIRYFERFVEKVSEELLGDVSYVIALNEPNVYSAFGYILGQRPPQEKNLKRAMIVYWNLALAHRRSYKVIKSVNPGINIGAAMGVSNGRVLSRWDLQAQFSMRFAEYAWNWWWLNRIKRNQDFVGINHYSTDYYKGWFRRENPKKPVNDLGWYMEPSGLHEMLLKTCRRYKKPIIISENGLADERDKHRKWWLEETLGAMEKAIADGVDLKGYLHWSLLDNFEWDKGWWPKFGLIEVDRENNMKRTVRPSAKWFADEIKKIRS